MKHPSNTRRGITLIELAIVLTIVALLIAGIVAGRSMIRNAELQKIATDFGRYREAVTLFRDKYHYLPGDMPNATDFWGTRTGCATDTAYDTMAEATCNGDGDAFITGSTGTGVGFGTDYREALFVWQHLANANLLEGAYSGVPSPDATWLEPGINIPRGLDDVSGFTLSYSKPGAKLYTIAYSGIGTIAGKTLDANYQHIISYGGTDQIAKDLTPTRPALSRADAKALDDKIDDGKPGLGNLLAIWSTIDGINGLCITTTSPKTAVYMSSVDSSGAAIDTKNCVLIFKTGIQ